MEKIMLFKKRSFGEVTGTAFELLRQNFRLISRSFLLIVSPVLAVSMFFVTVGVWGVANSNTFSDRSYFVFIYIGYFGFVLAMFAGALVIHELAIAYEHSDEPGTLEVSDIWERIKEDRPVIIRSFFGLVLFWVVYGIISAIVYYSLNTNNSFAARIASYFMNIVSVYLQVCLSHFLMLRLRSEYDISTSLIKSVWLTIGESRWWRTLGVHCTMFVVIISLYLASLIPAMIAAFICKAHMPGLDWHTMGYSNNIMLAGLGIVYTAVIFAYLNNMMLMGVTVNYYSLIEEKEHVGLMIGIAQIGEGDRSMAMADGEY